MKLSQKQKKFCVEYLVDFNATRAYLRAGFKCTDDSARANSARMIANDSVLKYIDELLFSVGITKQHILRRIYDIAMSSPAVLFNENGSLKSPSELSPDDAKTISSFKVSKRTEFEAGKAIGEIEIIEVKFWSKDKALENLGRYFKLFTDKVETRSTVEEKLAKILADADEVAARYFANAKKHKEKEAKEIKSISDDS